MNEHKHHYSIPGRFCIYVYNVFKLTLECVDHRRILKDEPGHILHFLRLSTNPKEKVKTNLLILFNFSQCRFKALKKIADIYSNIYSD